MRFAEFERLWEEKGKPEWPLATIVAKHTGVEGAGAAWFADRLHTFGIMNGYRVYSRAKDIEALRELETAIAKIQRLIDYDGPLTSLAHERLFMELFHGGIAPIWAMRALKQTPNKEKHCSTISRIKAGEIAISYSWWRSGAAQ